MSWEHSTFINQNFHAIVKLCKLCNPNNSHKSTLHKAFKDPESLMRQRAYDIGLCILLQTKLPVLVKLNCYCMILDLRNLEKHTDVL